MKILITGASRGIGLFLMQKLSAEGHSVFGTYHSTRPENEMTGQYSQVDVRDPGQVSGWVDSVLQPGDRIVLVNCAGTNYNSFAHKSDVEKWSQVISVNLIGSFAAIRAVLPHMRETGFGRIINFSSVVAQKGIPGTSAYAASKSALWGMAKSMAVENASKGITINNLNLGYFDIGMIKDVPEEMLNEIKKYIPAKTLGDAQNILNAVNFLIHAEYINGTSVDINGGLF